MKMCSRLRVGKAVCTGLLRSTVSCVVLCRVEGVSSQGTDTKGMILLWIKGGANSRWPERSNYSWRPLPERSSSNGFSTASYACSSRLFLLQWSTFLAQFFQEMKLYSHAICLSASPPLRAFVPLAHVWQKCAGLQSPAFLSVPRKLITVVRQTQSNLSIELKGEGRTGDWSGGVCKGRTQMLWKSGVFSSAVHWITVLSPQRQHSQLLA